MGHIICTTGKCRAEIASLHETAAQMSVPDLEQAQEAFLQHLRQLEHNKRNMDKKVG